MPPRARAPRLDGGIIAADIASVDETGPQDIPKPAGEPGRVGEVARYFLKLGFTAFGGPAAHLALMEDQLVNRRQWLDRQHFLDAIAAINFIPGPSSTELVIHLGYLRAGWRGLVVAGVCFILPAVLIILPLAWFYVTLSTRPQVQGILLGVSAAVVAIVATAAIRFAQTGLKDGFTVWVAIIAAAAEIVSHILKLPLGDVAILAAAGLAGGIWYARTAGNVSIKSVAIPMAVALAAGLSGAWISGMTHMALIFLKIGATLFGSGYVLVTYLQSNFVDQTGWLSNQEVLNAVAVGQVTPGPLLTTATFIGFILGYDQFHGGLVGGILGAIIATAAIFGPSFIFIAALGPVLPTVRRSPPARAALDGMNAAVVALIAVTTVFLGIQCLRGPLPLVSMLLTAITLAALLIGKVNATWLLVGAAALGWFFLTPRS